ncbi:uncharacterized protein G2W53_018646 [Senna tora]|uniref:Uncharacterized protein n=1 Tax=Senna tora TaxID=362788 RepID=A0A834WLI2_9FABA|nr:uncharacterized protein G2W53_018646 [Senna tora]
MPQSPAGVVPPVGPSFGPSFLDWSDVSFLYPFCFWCYASVRSTAQLPLVLCGFSPLFRPFSRLQWFFGTLSAVPSLDQALIMAGAPFLVLGVSFPVPAYKEGLVSLRNSGASSSRPSVVSFDVDDYSRTFHFSGHESEGSGFFIRGPGMGHVLSLEINFIVSVEVQPGLGPPNYDYVLRAKTFPTRGDVSRRVPPTGSSPFVPLFRPLAAGTFGVLI